MIQTWQDVFALFEKSPTKLGNAIGAGRQTANNMMVRGSIPPMYWKKLIESAADKGITHEILGRLATERPPGVAAE